ncbi:DNA-methyltransferase [Acetobacter malorum]|uniref:DNA-methyltransferase n=1 Tax=Acetobacter malorum TaxID=178901 RepID=UPI0039E96C4A
MSTSLFLQHADSILVQKPKRGKLSQDAANKIMCGDALACLGCLEDAIVDTIVTSPPYFGQRDYGVKDQLGLEAESDDYIERLVSTLGEARRVLKESGTLWLNIGDKYINGALMGIPWRVALALQKDGWILRSDIIWHKPNAMPHSVKTRPTPDHEYIFLLSKAQTYYYDVDAIREPHVTFSEASKMRGGRNHFGKRGSTPESGKNGGNANLHNARWDQAFHEKGRNRRTVWSVPLGKFREAHFAVFPEKLIEPCILAGSPKGGLVMDPFFGSGTTGIVALLNERKFLGIDINPEYCKMAANRIVQLGLF